MGFQSSDTTHSAPDGSNVNRTHAEPPTNPPDAIDSLITPPTAQPMGAVLPPFENQAFMSQRHEVNPALALNLLGDIQQQVVAWQEQLRQLARAIHAITAQGPMVNGWLESSLTPQNGFGEFSQDGANSAEASLLRHGDADALMQYVDALESRHDQDNQGTQGSAAGRHLEAERIETGRNVASGDARTNDTIAQYRLCSLSEDGLVRSQPCPPEQMASVSTAIARYQKFKQLVAKKDVLESKLQQTVDELTGLRSRFQQD